MPKASFYHLRFQLSQKLSVFFFVCRYYTMKLRTVKKKNGVTSLASPMTSRWRQLSKILKIVFQNLNYHWLTL